MEIRCRVWCGGKVTTCQMTSWEVWSQPSSACRDGWHQIETNTQSGPALRDGLDKIRFNSPLENNKTIRAPDGFACRVGCTLQDFNFELPFFVLCFFAFQPDLTVGPFVGHIFIFIWLLTANLYWMAVWWVLKAGKVGSVIKFLINYVISPIKLAVRVEPPRNSSNSLICYWPRQTSAAFRTASSC